MLCPLCDSDEDFTLEELQTHLREIHKYNDDALTVFGDTYEKLVRVQMRKEKLAL